MNMTETGMNPCDPCVDASRITAAEETTDLACPTAALSEVESIPLLKERGSAVSQARQLGKIIVF